MDIVTATVFAVLMIAFVFGGFWFLFSAFRTGVHWGLICLIPFGAIYFLIEKPKEARPGCLIQLAAIAGFVLLILVKRLINT